MLSLRSRLWILWGLAFSASLVVALLLAQLYRASNAAQLSRAQAVVAQACDGIRDRYRFYVSGWDGGGASADRRYGDTLAPVLIAALSSRDGVAGGIWSATAGSLAFAFPTAARHGVSAGFPASLPDAERDAVAALASQSVDSEQSTQRAVSAESGRIELAACPLGGPIGGLAAWTMLRVPPVGSDTLRLGLGVLLLLLLGIAVWVARLTTRWGRHVSAIETALQNPSSGLPSLAPTGEPELDRVVAAINQAGRHLTEARAAAEASAAQAAKAERLASLGRVAAGIAHEIRNPIAAIRLRAENALAGDETRQRPALEASLVQVARVDRLVSELLAMTQRRTPVPAQVALRPFLSALADQHRRPETASILVEADGSHASFDAELIGRALDNLLLNALRHTRPDGCVTLRADRAQGWLRLGVSDTGSGVDGAIRSRLFEPFATGRPDGIGLGLAIAREMAEAHGGSLSLSEPEHGSGAVFILALPQDPE
jgi:signal transduction histidine kinase